jgi:hypothetical protein
MHDPSLVCDRGRYLQILYYFCRYLDLEQFGMFEEVSHVLVLVLLVLSPRNQVSQKSNTSYHEDH